MLEIFDDLIKSIQEGDKQWESLEQLMEERADIALRHAFDGFGISYEEAIEILRDAEDLTNEQQTKRNILIAATDNIIDFSVAEEYQMVDHFSDVEELMIDEELTEDDIEDMLAIFYKYNHTYAWVENLDIEYAMAMAAYLMFMKEETTLTYTTMGDERVRPWHRQYEGYSAPKSRFPGWLIPPIEHGCRCYLVEDHTSVFGQIKNDIVSNSPEMPEWFDPTFKESVAQGGRIFSDEHPYFQIDEAHELRLNEIASRIKAKYING